MPEFVALDEVPGATGDSDIGSDIPAGSIACPECGEYFKSRGLTRHMVQTHGMQPPARRTPGTPERSNTKLATQWAEFQRGAALFISFACSECAAVIVEDAERDGIAIAAFCENRPKLKKQIQQALTGMDVMILVGALGETARKCMAHHEIGKKIGLPGPQHSHAGGQSAQEKMLSFLTMMPEADRNMLLNRVFTQMSDANASSSAPAAAPTTVTVVMDDENTPGAPPPPDMRHITPQDEYQMAMAHSATGDLSQTL
jgi:hypothetical protein